MLTGWLDLPGATARLRWLSALTGLDLIRLGTTAGRDEITDTAVAQPLIVTLGLLAAAELPLSTETGAHAVAAGHSVGEITAAAVAGVFSDETAVALAALRGRAMAAACGRTPTGMAAVIGGDPDEVSAAIEARGLSAANRNGGGQIVAAGAVDALRRLLEDAPAGTRVVPLSVAGAFHTEFMASAEAELARVADGIPTADPELLLLCNAEGTAVTTGPDTVKRLVRQLISPVRWDLCQSTLRELGVTAAIELPPAGTLTGLAKRELPGMTVLACKTPDDLPAARALIEAETLTTPGEYTPDWRMVTSPIRGQFAPADVAEGAAVRAGTPLGEVTSRRESVHISAAYDATVVEWLVAATDLVDPGDPIARLEPDPYRS